MCAANTLVFRSITVLYFFQKVKGNKDAIVTENCLIAPTLILSKFDPGKVERLHRCHSCSVVSVLLFYHINFVYKAEILDICQI